MAVDLSKKYQKKTDKEHILSNPDTYIGSVEIIENQEYIFNETDKNIVQQQISIIPGLYKLFDEGIVNCRDHSVRMKNVANEGAVGGAAVGGAAAAAVSHKVSKIDVSVDKDGLITFCNDGNGIDIVKHPEYNIWIPEMIFGHLRTGTNYDKSEKKIVGGKNGFGVKLIYIWSTMGTLETIDHKRGLKYTQTFSNNLDVIGEPVITKTKAKPYTKITFKPDYPRFGLPTISEDIIMLFKKRVYDIAAITEKSVKVSWNGSPVPVKREANP